MNKVKKRNEIWSQNSIYFEGMKKKEIEFGRKILFIQPESEKKRMEFGRKILFKNLTKSTYFLCIPNLTTDTI